MSNIVKKVGSASALAALAKRAAAGRQVEVRYEEALVFVIDHSVSMMRRAPSSRSASHPSFESRMEAVQRSVLPQHKKCRPGRTRTGLVTFGEEGKMRAAIAKPHALVSEALSGVRPLGGTCLWRGLAVSRSMLARELPRPSVLRVVALSDGEDGEPTRAISEAQACGEAGVVVDSVWFGEEGDGGDDLLRRVSELTGGKFARCTDASELEEKFVQLEVEARGLLLGDGKKSGA